MRAQLTRVRFIPLFFLWLCDVMGQNPTRQEPPKVDPVEVLSPKGVNVGQVGSPVLKYSGNVKLRHRGILLFCDQALYQVNGNRVEAIGHVLVVQGDTIIVKADTMVYEGKTRQVMLRGRVTFQDRRIILNAAQLDYSLGTGIAHYTARGRLVDSRNVLTSREGYYDTKTRQIELMHTVRLVSSESTLTAEALMYDIASRLATLVEPTRITGRDGVNVVQRGQYDTQEGKFQQNETTAILKFARTTDSLAQTSALQSVLSKGSLALLTTVDKPLVSQSSPNTPAGSSLPGETVSPKTSAKPTAYPALVTLDKKKQRLSEPLARPDTTNTPPGIVTVVESLKAASGSKAVAKSPVVARTPVKRELPVSAAATLVPTGKPDEQVTLATPGIGQSVSKKSTESVVRTAADSVAAPTKPLETPVRLTRAVSLKPVGTTAIRLQSTPMIGQKVSPLPPVQHDSAYLAAAPAAVPPKPAINTVATGPVKKMVPIVRSPVKPVETNATPPMTGNSDVPVIATTIVTPKAALPGPSMRQVTNPQSGSGSTFRAAVVVPTKRVNPVPAKRASPDLDESDLERELNKKKRHN